MSNKNKPVHALRSVRPKKHKSNARNPGTVLACAAMQSFVCGTLLCVLLLCGFAFLLANTPLPLSLVRPFSCLAAAAGVALSSLFFSKKIGQRYLLCGGLCGLFCAACQLTASFVMQGPAFWQNGSLLMAAVLMMSGLFGGAFAAARSVH